MSEKDTDYIVFSLPPAGPYRPSPAELEALRRCRVFSGTERQRGLLAGILPETANWHSFTTAAALLELGEKTAACIGVFASGDPLFYGIASTLRERAPAAKLQVFPSKNFLQVLSHRLLLPNAALCACSVHGRGWAELDAALLRGERLIGVLTDGKNHPATIAERLLEYGFSHYRAHLGECLETPEERVGTFALEDLRRYQAKDPNCLILSSDRARRPSPGIADERFEGLSGRPDMITKMPIRLSSLSRLDLGDKRCLWDIGFCTGSVSIEARRLHPHLEVVAFEKRTEGAALLAINARRHGAPGIRGIEGDFFQQDLGTLPRPDAVFIGGHGGRLEELLPRIDAVLLGGGCIVTNAVLPGTIDCFCQKSRQLGYRLGSPLRLQVDAHNPITILHAHKVGPDSAAELHP